MSVYHLFVLALAAVVVAEMQMTASAAAAHPNFVFILTDDQARWDLAVMNKTRKLLEAEGVLFENYMVNTPICCPSRTEMLSGRYYHNAGAPNGTCMHVNAEELVFDPSTLFSQLHSNGYVTGVFGKVINGQQKCFCKEFRSEGMTMVGSPCKEGDFYGNQYFVKHPNGTHYIETLDKSLETTYQTSQLGNRTLDWINSVVKENASQPFFAYIGPHAPHYSADPAAWHQDRTFSDMKAPRTPNWNESCPDKHGMIANNPPLDMNATIHLDHQHQVRWMSLLSVDDVVEAVYNDLEKLGILDNTYIIFSSDHGYHLGQWRVPSSKQQPYDTDIFVPTLMRGPGIKAGSSCPNMVGNVDLAPTILTLAGIDVPEVMDGKSFAQLIVKEENPFYKQPLQLPANSDSGTSVWRDAFLIQYKSVGTYDNTHAVMWWPADTFKGRYEHPPGMPCQKCPHWWLDGPTDTWRGLRLINETHNMLYVEFNPNWVFDGTQGDVFHELYDVNKDPYQMTNIYESTPKGTTQELHKRLDKYASCQGGSTNGNCP